MIPAHFLNNLSDAIAPILTLNNDFPEDSHTWGGGGGSGGRGLEINQPHDHFEKRRPVQSKKIQTSVIYKYLLQAAGTHHSDYQPCYGTHFVEYQILSV